MTTRKEIRDGIRQIEETLKNGGYLASDALPCAAVAHYDDCDPDAPWHISDDYATESYATIAEAIAGAKEWCELIAKELESQRGD